MKRKIVLRGALGFPLGIAIGNLITIGISLIWAQGYYAPCVPELISVMGNELNAVILQTLLCGLLGVGFGGGSVIWELDDWGIMKQTGVYFVIVSLFMMPVAYAAYWMEHSMKGFLSYFGIFALIFAVIWAVQFTAGKRMVKKLNANLSGIKKSSDGNRF